MLPAKDTSRWNGAYVNTGEAIDMIKISGGDQGLYVDSEAAASYQAVIAAGKAFGGYHFAGGGNPVTEAKYYLNAMLPWNQGEVPALDIESGLSWNPNAPGVDPVAWTMAFINQVQTSTGNAGGLIYMNLATLNAHDWTPVLERWGLWLADWNDPTDPTGGTINTTKTVVMLQYSDGPIYDHDEYYGTLQSFKSYGWGAPVASPAPAPTPEPTPPAVPVPAPVTPVTTPPVTEPPTEPVSTPDPTPVETPTEPDTTSVSTPVPEVKTPVTNVVVNDGFSAEETLFERFISWLKSIFKKG